MKIETKFNVGDEVFVCQKHSKCERVTCKICMGKGNVLINGKYFQCPECYGNKITDGEWTTTYTAEKRIIVKVVTSTTNNNGDIQVHIKYIVRENNPNYGKRDRSIAEFRNIIFYTLEEAEYRCKELNGEIIRIPNAMIINEFADKIKVSPAEIIKWLFLRGKVVSNNSEIWFEDMREFADKYGFICEKEGMSVNE